MLLEYQSDPVTLSAPLFSWLLVVSDTCFSHHTSAALLAACLLRLLLSGLMEDGVWLHFPRLGSPVPISCIYAAITSWRFLSSLLLANYPQSFSLPSISFSGTLHTASLLWIHPSTLRPAVCTSEVYRKEKGWWGKTASRDRLPCAVLCLSLSRVQLFATLWTVALDCSLQGSSVHGILQARILEWVAMPSSRASFQLRDQTQVAHPASGPFTVWA